MESLFLPSGRRIDYLLRRSPTAGRMRIVMKTDGTVELVLPRFVPEEEGRAFLMQSGTWIDRTRHKVLSRPAVRQIMYPEHFTFPVSHEELSLRYEFLDVCWCGASDDSRVLTVSGNVTERDLVQKALEQYLIRKAQKVFEKELAEIAQSCMLPFETLTIRLQKGRWGSCSSRKHISLNARLLFLSPEEVHYVMIHELCHTRYLNHSGKFWLFVEQFCPQWRRIRDNMKHTELPL